MVKTVNKLISITDFMTRTDELRNVKDFMQGLRIVDPNIIISRTGLYNIELGLNRHGNTVA